MQNDEIIQNLNMDMNFKHISYREKVTKGYTELLQTNTEEVIDRGWKERDDTFGGIWGGKMYLVGAETGVGKSTFVNQVCRNVSRAGWNVVKYSLEDRMEDIAKEELYYECNRMAKKEKLAPYTRVKFIRNEYPDDPERGEKFMKHLIKAGEILSREKITELDKNKDVTIDDLIVLMGKECDNGAKMFAIDHLHYFEFDDANRLDLQIKNVMHKLNEIARKRNVAIFLIAHYKNTTGVGTPKPSWFRDAAAIKQTANVIIQIQRDEDEDNPETHFHITKMRGPVSPPIFTSGFDLATYEYSFKKHERQKEREKKNNFIS